MLNAAAAAADVEPLAGRGAVLAPRHRFDRLHARARRLGGGGDDDDHGGGLAGDAAGEDAARGGLGVLLAGVSNGVDVARGRRQRLGARADWRETASELRDQKTARGRTPCARRRSTTTPPRVPMPTTATPAPSVLPPEVASPAAADGTDARAQRRDRKAPARGILPEFERSARAREASIRGRETATKGIRAVTTTAGATMMARETRGRECEARGRE